jgi:AraC-like DNA-binding protein
MLHDPRLPGVEVLQAHYFTYRYARHWHEAVCVAVVDAGAAAFDCGHSRHVAPAGSVFVIPAYEVHTGEAAASAGLGYRALYIRPGSLAGLLGDSGAAEPDIVPRSGDLVRRDTAAAAPLLRFHRAMTRPASPLERQHALMTAALAVAAEYGPWSRSRRALPREHRAVRRARDYLHAHPADPVTLGDLAQVSGLSMYRLAHTFKADTGLAPHAYQVQLRVLQAKQLLAAGRSIAETAAECGFFDQAHLTSQFKRHVGVTPGIYARGTASQSATRGMQAARQDDHYRVARANHPNTSISAPNGGSACALPDFRLLLSVMPPIGVARSGPPARRGVTGLEVAAGRGARRCCERTVRRRWLDPVLTWRTPGMSECCHAPATRPGLARRPEG